MRQNDSGKNVYTSQDPVPFSTPHLPVYRADDGKNGVSIQDTLLEPFIIENHGNAANFDHIRSFPELQPGDTAILPQLLPQQDPSPPGAISRQLRSSGPSNFEPEDAASTTKAQLHSRRQADFEPEETARTKKARAAARCRHNNKTTLRLKDDLRERNRVAAAKHRVKKREAICSLEESVRAAGAENRILAQQVRLLREQLTHWRTLALQHLPGEGGCRCAAVHMYNAAKAHQLVNGVEDAALLLPRPPTLQASIS